MLKAGECIAEDVIGLALHLVEFFAAFRATRLCQHIKQPLAQSGVGIALVALEVRCEPGAD